MAFRSTEHNKPNQIAQTEGAFSTDIAPQAGTPLDVPKVKFLGMEKFSSTEKFDASAPVITSTRPEKRRSKRRNDKLRKYFREVKLTEEQEKAIKLKLKECIAGWKQDRGDLPTRLSRWNDLVEGIREETDFPWEGAANLHVPLTEIQMNIIHSAVRQTMLKNDSLWVGEYFGTDNEMLAQMLQIENFLNFKSRTDLSLNSVFSEIVWSTLRDGTSVAQVTWCDEREKCKRLKTYETVEDFVDVYPTPQQAEITAESYAKILDQLTRGEEVEIEEEYEKILYRGPLVDLVELNDFVMYPMTAYETRFSTFVGKRFNLNLSAVFAAERQGWYRQGTADKIKQHSINKDGTKRNETDYYTNQRDLIEGISRPSKGEDLQLYDGILRYDLNDDGENERYAVTFDDASDTLLAFWDYPYEHAKDCFVPLRFKKRPKRFLGVSIPGQLEDINEEVDIQHNQRINSRTITTVPTFKAQMSLKGQFDPSRKDMRFKPGQVYWLSKPEALDQFKMNETDFSQSDREEQNSFQIADNVTGASQLRSGRESRLDPRAPALKVQTLLQQSNIRLDDGMEELAGDSMRNEGFNGIGYQVMELYRQFGDDEDFKFPQTIQAREMDDQGRMTTGKIEMSELDHSKLETEKMKIMMSKTSVSQNPDAQFQKEYLIYQILQNEPLVGGNQQARRQMVSDLLASARKEKLRRILAAEMAAMPPDMAQANGTALMNNVLSSMGRGGMNAGQGTGQTGI